MSYRYCLGLDFGGTKLAAGLVELESGRLVASRRAATPSSGGREASIALMMQLANEVSNATDLPSVPAVSAVSAGAQIVGVGVSFGGHVDPHTGTIARSMHVPGWEGFPLRKYLEDSLSVPAAVENDANAVALGLRHYGVGKAYERFIYVTVSTGIGGAVVIENDVLSSRHNLAGEIGHMPMKEDGPTCTCGKQGCLEALASGPAIARMARKRALANPAAAPHLMDFLHKSEELSQVRGEAGAEVPIKAGAELRAEDVFAAARAGDGVATAVLDEAARYLGRGIACAVNLLDPDAVLVGGGVVRANPDWFETVVREAKNGVLPQVAVDLEIERVVEDVEAALIGAAAVFRTQFSP